MTEPVEAPFLLADRYLLGAELGRGGMAVVYRAWDSTLNREVAVKMLREPLTDPVIRARFQIEGHTLAALNHPNLTMIFDAGTEGDRPYLVMELVTGSTLSKVSSWRRLDVAEVAAIDRALADALVYVHGRAIVHRDVKPSNVLIDDDQRVRLADFGIARLLHSPVRHTATGLTMGTPAYLSPEQVRGEQATPASDIYALGLVLLEAATGRPAFTGSQDVIALARLLKPPAIDDWLPADLRSLLSGMTAETPAQRPTAAEVASRLRTLDTMPAAPVPEAVTGRHPNRADPTVSLSTRRSLALTMAVTIALVVTAAVLTFGWPFGTAQHTAGPSGSGSKPARAATGTAHITGGSARPTGASTAQPAVDARDISTPQSPTVATLSPTEAPTKPAKAKAAKARAVKAKTAKAKAAKAKAANKAAKKS